MVYISFNPKSFKSLIKYIVIFYLTSFVFGGVAFSLIYMIKPREVFIKNGLFFGMYPLKIIFIGAIIASIVLIFGFKIVKNKMSKKDMFCKLYVQINGKTAETIAMVDTGNMLIDPISGKAVIVVEKVVLEDILPKDILENTDKILGGEFQSVTDKVKSEFLTKFKLIPYSSLGKENGMLLGIKVDTINVVKDEEKIRRDNVIIGIYNKKLSKKGEYRALIGIDFI